MIKITSSQTRANIRVTTILNAIHMMVISESFRTRYSIKTILLIFVCFYFLSLAIIVSFLDWNKCNTPVNQYLTLPQASQPTTKKVLTEFRFSIVILEFEFFANDLFNTSLALCDLSENIEIIIVSERSIYPPIDFNVQASKKCKIKVVNINADARKSQNESRPENFITYDYVLIVPDYVRLPSFGHLKQIKQFLDAGELALAIPVGHNSRNYCLLMNVNRKKWTIRYKIYRTDSTTLFCEAFNGNFAILVKKSSLLQLNLPFARPFLKAFTLQSKIKKLRIQVVRDFQFAFDRQLEQLSDHVKWKRESFNQLRLKQLYNNFGIKRVINWDESTNWFGCNKTTNRCFGSVYNDIPEYLVDGRWTPPCCLEHLRTTARYVFSILEKNDVRYWLEGGSLLGAARSGDIIPWDYDVDIGIYQEDIPNCEHLEAATTGPIVDEQGYVWEKAKEGDFYRVQFSQTNHLHVDIFPFYSRNGTMTKNTWFSTHPQDSEFPEHFLQPLEKINFVDWKASAPNNIVKFLELKFGPGVIQHPKYPKDYIMPL